MKIRAFLRKHDFTQEAFAAKLGCSSGLVWQWMAWQEGASNGTRITAEWAKKIERETRGEVPRHETRPDIFDKQVAA